MTETANVSVRMNRETAAHIRARAEARGERLSDALHRRVSPGDRLPVGAGRSPGGPGRWPRRLGDLLGGTPARQRKAGAERIADDLSLTPDRVDVALRYAAEFPEEIEARIELHERETAHYESLAGD